MPTPTFNKPHLPNKLKNGKDEQIKKDVLAAIEAGMPLGDAFGYAGVVKQTFKQWSMWFKEDLVNGFTDTPLINLFNEVMIADKRYALRVHKVISKKALEEEDTRMLMYIADNRLKYANKRRNNIELGSSEQNNIQINIIDMKSVDSLPESDVEEIEVNGISRDDSDSAEMD